MTKRPRKRPRAALRNTLKPLSYHRRLRSLWTQALLFSKAWEPEDIQFYFYTQGRGWPTWSIRAQRVNVSVSVGSSVSATTQLCVAGKQPSTIENEWMWLCSNTTICQNRQSVDSAHEPSVTGTGPAGVLHTPPCLRVSVGVHVRAAAHHTSACLFPLPWHHHGRVMGAGRWGPVLISLLFSALWSTSRTSSWLYIGTCVLSGKSEEAVALLLGSAVLSLHCLTAAPRRSSDTCSPAVPSSGPSCVVILPCVSGGLRSWGWCGGGVVYCCHALPLTGVQMWTWRRWGWGCVPLTSQGRTQRWLHPCLRQHPVASMYSLCLPWPSYQVGLPTAHPTPHPGEPCAGGHLKLNSK